MNDRSGWGTLFVVGTPIGNLDDISARALDTLGSVSVCYAEDTRRTGRLFSALGVETPLRSLHRHNEEGRTGELLGRLRGGEDVAIVSDSGTPTVSDPGRRAVSVVLEAGGRVAPIPGASAVPAALSVSGFEADRCYFAGFAPRKGTARREWIAGVVGSRATTVVFEAPGRLAGLLEALVEEGLGHRRAVVCRELTKLHEEVSPGTIGELATVYADRTVKGEVTVVIEAADEEPVVDEEAVAGFIAEMTEAGEGRRKIAEELRERFGMARNEAYRRSLEAEGGAE